MSVKNLKESRFMGRNGDTVTPPENVPRSACDCPCVRGRKRGFTQDMHTYRVIGGIIVEQYQVALVGSSLEIIPYKECENLVL